MRRPKGASLTIELCIICWFLQPVIGHGRPTYEKIASENECLQVEIV